MPFCVTKHMQWLNSHSHAISNFKDTKMSTVDVPFYSTFRINGFACIPNM